MTSWRLAAAITALAAGLAPDMAAAFNSVVSPPYFELQAKPGAYFTPRQGATLHQITRNHPRRAGLLLPRVTTIPNNKGSLMNSRIAVLALIGSLGTTGALAQAGS